MLLGIWGNISIANQSAKKDAGIRDSGVEGFGEKDLFYSLKPPRVSIVSKLPLSTALT